MRTAFASTARTGLVPKFVAARLESTEASATAGNSSTTAETTSTVTEALAVGHQRGDRVRPLPERGRDHRALAQRAGEVGAPEHVGAEVDVRAVVGARLERDRVAREVAGAGGRLADGHRRRLRRHREDELGLLAARGERRVVADRRGRAVDREVVDAVARDGAVEIELRGGAGGDRAEGLEAGAVDGGPGVEGDGGLAPRVVADPVHGAARAAG